MTVMVLLWRALRGAVVGLVVVAIFAGTSSYASRVVAEQVARSTADLNGVEVLGSEIGTWLSIAVPAGLVASFLLAWLLRLRRPWVVPSLGPVLACLGGTLLVAAYDHGAPGVVWALVFALSYALAAVVPVDRRPAPPPAPVVLPPAPPVTLTLDELRGDR